MNKKWKKIIIIYIYIKKKNRNWTKIEKNIAMDNNRK